MNEQELERLAKMAYGAYGQVTEYKNYQGLPMSTWEALTPKIQEAWKAAALYAYTQSEGNEMIKHLEPDHK